jgi:hypothetical protein
MHELLERLTHTAGTVVVFTGFDPRGRLPMSRMLAARAATYNASIRWSADQLGARVVDLWIMAGLSDPHMWANDRLHLSTEGHALIADAVLDVLGVTPRHGAAPPPQLTGRPWLSARRSDAQWVGSYFAPWVARKVRGRSAGDLVDPKRPMLSSVPVGGQPD